MPSYLLNEQEQLFYARQISLPEFGVSAQLKLKTSNVFVAGAGGLGCPALTCLAGAGVGNITIADGDIVQVNNLHRQVLYNTSDIGKNKAIVASEKIVNLNPHIQVTAVSAHVTKDNVDDLLKNADLVIDATDNFETRFLLGDYTSGKKMPLIFAAIYGFEGQLTVFNYKNGPSFRDLFTEFPAVNAIPNCAVNGVTGFVPGITGCLQAAEAIKIITGTGEVMCGKLLLLDLLTLTKKELFIKRSGNTSNLNLITEKMTGEINITELREKLDSVFLLDVRESFEFNNYNMGGTLIPLRDLPNRLSDIPSDKDIVVVCESGVRSMHAAKYLSGIFTQTNVYNLMGGLKVLKQELG